MLTPKFPYHDGRTFATSLGDDAASTWWPRRESTDGKGAEPVNLTKIKEMTEREMLAALVAAWEPLMQHFAGMVAERVTTKVQAELEPPQPRYYTRQETADLLHITLPTLQRLTDDGRLEAHRAGRRVLYRADRIDEMITNGVKLKYLRKAER